MADVSPCFFAERTMPSSVQSMNASLLASVLEDKGPKNIVPRPLIHDIDPEGQTTGELAGELKVILRLV